jgi:hypothetical protein
MLQSSGISAAVYRLTRGNQCDTGSKFDYIDNQPEFGCEQQPFLSAYLLFKAAAALPRALPKA